MAQQDKTGDRLTGHLDALEQKINAGLACDTVAARLDVLKKNYPEAIATRASMRQVLRRAIKEPVTALSLLVSGVATAAVTGALVSGFSVVAPVAVGVALVTAPVCYLATRAIATDCGMHILQRRYKSHYERFAGLFQKLERQTIDDLKTCAPEIIAPLPCYAYMKSHFSLSWQFARTLDRAHNELRRAKGLPSQEARLSGRYHYWP